MGLFPFFEGFDNGSGAFFSNVQILKRIQEGHEHPVFRHFFAKLYVYFLQGLMGTEDLQQTESITPSPIPYKLETQDLGRISQCHREAEGFEQENKRVSSCLHPRRLLHKSLGGCPRLGYRSLNL